MEKKTYVYLHRRKDTGEIFYVGIGNIKRPYSYRDRNNFWKKIVKKYGYKVEVLYVVDTWVQACIIEIMLIEKYGRRDLGLGTLVNMTNGGDGSFGVLYTEERRQKIIKSNKTRIITEETKRKIRQSQLGEKNASFGKKRSKETRKKIGDANRRRIITEETKRKMSNSHKGKTLSIEQKKKISLRVRGENHPETKLKNSDVIWIRENYIARDKDFGMTALSKKYNVSFGIVDRIIRRITWKHI